MFVHGDNLTQKENHQAKYLDGESKNYLREIRAEYTKWKAANLALVGPLKNPTENDDKIITDRVKLFNDYKDFIDQQRYAEKFDSRSNLHSSVLEEFNFYLFKDLVASIGSNALIGKAHTFKDIFFNPSSFEDMVKTPNTKIEVKDHDFVIGTTVHTTFICNGQTVGESYSLDVPAVAIECKTYLDKTMLEGASSAAHELRTRNPNSLYIVLSEWLKLTENVNLKKYFVDQIYILRKQKNTDREYRYEEGYVKNPIYADVVVHLFGLVRAHLTASWQTGQQSRLDRGFLK